MTMRRILPAAVLSVLACAAPAVALAQPAPASSVIVATGQSRLTVAPDQAWLVVNLETRDAKGPEARRLGATAMTSVMAKLKSTGLAADAIQTIGFSLHPEYDYVNGRQRMKGFVVSNQVQVRIDDVNAVADVLDAVGGLTLPASSTVNIGNLRFDLKNRAGVEREALTLAVRDARERAAAMAAGAGMTVGRILRIDEGGVPPPMPKFEAQQMSMARAVDAMVATPITPSDIEVRAQVTLTVEIR